MKKGWVFNKLGDICEMYQPKTISTKEMVDNGAYPVFGANGVIGKYDKYNHVEPQLLITCRGATCGSVNISEPYSWINGNAMVVRPNDHSIDLRFLEYLFRGGIDLSKTITGAAQPQITRQSLAPVEISYPKSLSEQKRIVAILDEAFAAIDKAKANAEQNLKNAKELFESYLQEVFMRKGQGWEEKTLEELTTKIGSGATPRGGQENYKAEGISLVRSMNVYDWEFRETNLAFIDDEQARDLNNVTLHENDVLLNITGASVARCCVFPKEYLPARVNQHVSIIRVKRELLDARFLNFLLTSKPYKDQLLATGEQGATRQAITKSQIESFRITIPPLTIQQSLVRQLVQLRHELIKLEAIHRHKLINMEELKKSILQKAFDGELKLI